MNSSYDFSFKKRAVVLSAAATATAATLLWRWSRKKTTVTVPTDASLPVPTLCPSPSLPKLNSQIPNIFRIPNPRGFSDLLLPPSSMMISTSRFNSNDVNNLTKHNAANNNIISSPNFINHQTSSVQPSNFITPSHLVPSSPSAPSTMQPTIHHQTTRFVVATTITAVRNAPIKTVVPVAPAVQVAPTASLLDSSHVTRPVIIVPPPTASSSSNSTGKSITVKRWINSEDGYIRVPSYRLNKLLGSGGYGEVWHATDANGVEVAVKLFKTVGDPKEIKENCCREYNVLSEFVTLKWVPNVYGLCDIQMEITKHAIVMEYICGGMLRDQLRGGKRICEKRSAKIIAQVAEALCGLHSQTMIHKDVKPHNILVYGHERDDVKLIDFGIAKRASELNGKEDPGTELFCAPEILNQQSYGTPVDMFALGVTLYRMLYGKMPFMTEHLIVAGIDAIFSDIRVKISHNAKDLLKRLLNKTPTMRPLASDIQRHPWIKHHLQNITR